MEASKTCPRLNALRSPDSLPFLVLNQAERILLWSELEGRHGTNCASGNRSLSAADSDLDATLAWLARFVGAKTTFEKYRGKRNACCYGRTSR